MKKIIDRNLISKEIKKINELLIKYFGKPKRKNPLPGPLDLLIATILSQNTNDNNSYKAFKNLKENYSSWDQLLKINRIKIENAIRVAGLAKQKSETIKNLLTNISKTGVLDLGYLKYLDNSSAIKELTAYKGIGIKTASCVLLFAFDKNVCPVDTHVHRTLNRIGIVTEKTPDKTYMVINENFPDGIAHSFHTNLIRLGREICKPSKPLCSICPLKRICRYPKKNLTEVKNSKQRDFLLLDNVS